MVTKYNRRYPEIKWWRSEIQTEILKSEVNNNPNLYQIFKEKRYVSDMIDRDIEFRVLGGEDNWVTIYIVGQTGTMKSSMSQSIALRHDKTGYDAKRICFSYEELQTGISNSQPKEFFTLDDATFKHGHGARRIIEGIQTSIETLRKRGNSLTIISPEMKYFSESLFTFILETIDSALLGICPHNNKLHEVRLCKCYMEKTYKIKTAFVRALVKQNGVYIGFYECPIFWGNQLWKDYSIKKDEFIKRVTKQEHNQGNHEELAQKLYEDAEFKTYKNKKQISIFVSRKLSYLTSKENDIITEILCMKRKQDYEQKQEITEEDL
jgi:hypothetical protein